MGWGARLEFGGGGFFVIAIMTCSGDYKSWFGMMLSTVCYLKEKQSFFDVGLRVMTRSDFRNNAGRGLIRCYIFRDVLCISGY